jgi:hypothetical protein
VALPPTVPTSFVPKQPVQTTRRAARGGGNLFLLASMILMGLAIAGAGAVFGYQYVLESIRDKKAEELAAAEASISRATIDEFLRLHNRLNVSEELLNEHLAISQFLDVLESLTVNPVVFDSLSLEMDEQGIAEVNMKGTADTFNALAAESAAFAAEKRIKRAIFSGIGVAEKGGITFSLRAELDPALITWDGVPSAGVVAPAISATSTAP